MQPRPKSTHSPSAALLLSTSSKPPPQLRVNSTRTMERCMLLYFTGPPVSRFLPSWHSRALNAMEPCHQPDPAVSPKRTAPFPLRHEPPPPSSSAFARLCCFPSTANAERTPTCPALPMAATSRRRRINGHGCQEPSRALAAHPIKRRSRSPSPIPHQPPPPALYSSSLLASLQTAAMATPPAFLTPPRSGAAPPPRCVLPSLPSVTPTQARLAPSP